MSNNLIAMVGKVLLGFLLALGVISSNAWAGEGEPTVKKGKLLFQDTFGRKELGEAWSVHPHSFRIEKGVLIAAQRPDADHGAVSQTFVDFKDVVLEFSFKFDGSPGFNVVIDDRHHRDSHAGHICRVTVRRGRVTLQDDKTGAMRNDIFKMRRDPKRRKEAAKLLIGKSKSVPVKFKPGQWYTMKVTLTGSTMRVDLDGKPLATLQSLGIDHKKKTDFGFTVIDRSMHFDNIAAWDIVQD